MSTRVGMFHYRDNLYFGRRADGAVRIVKFATDGGVRPHACWFHNERAVTEQTEYPLADGEFRSVQIVLDLTIPAEHWASIVASVSAGGESSGRYHEARQLHEKFHNSATIEAVADQPVGGGK